jgi:hypothetical protein
MSSYDHTVPTKITIHWGFHKKDSEELESIKDTVWYDAQAGEYVFAFTHLHDKQPGERQKVEREIRFYRMDQDPVLSFFRLHYGPPHGYIVGCETIFQISFENVKRFPVMDDVEPLDDEDEDADEDSWWKDIDKRNKKHFAECTQIFADFLKLLQSKTRLPK